MPVPLVARGMHICAKMLHTSAIDPHKCKNINSEQRGLLEKGSFGKGVFGGKGVFWGKSPFSFPEIAIEVCHILENLEIF